MNKLFTHLNKNYLTLREAVGKEVIQSKMRKLIQVALTRDKWNKKKCKFGYYTWMENMLNGALYNTELVIEKYIIFLRDDTGI
jgi:hypothetical protein